MKRPLELYIHIPFCMKKCDYCDFLSFPADERTQWNYASALMREIQYYGKLMGGYEVKTIYIGGGTPSWLDERAMVQILDVLGDNFHINRKAEVTLECNPGTVTQEKLNMYVANGINRLSIGLQSTDDEELKLLGRVHTFSKFLKTYDMARRAGFENINVDLMSGIPHQDLEKFAKSLLRVIRLKPEHISVYSLMIEEGTPFYNKYKFDLVMQQAGLKPQSLPDEEEMLRIMQATRQLLASRGYERYEISNYAKPGYACRHNLGYWDRTEYLGLGLGAASLLGDIRYTNIRDVFDYIKNVNEIELRYFTSEEHPDQECVGINLHESVLPLDRKEQMEEFMFLGLRKTEGITREDFAQKFGSPIESVYLNVIRKLQQEELLELESGRIFLTEKGMDVSNYAMAAFLL